ncbi:23035_t:CDS:1, partial [Gigaspora margarita]
GLRPKYAINVQVAEPATLNAAITEARKWENGRLMAILDNDISTSQAIDKLSEQIAKSSINLAERQATPTPTPVYYSDKNQKRSLQNRNAGSEAICYYCRNKGHFVRHCQLRREDNERRTSDRYRDSSSSKN